MMLANDTQLWIPAKGVFPQLLEAFGASTEKKMRACRLAMGQAVAHESRAINAILELGTLLIEAPYQRHAVWNKKVYLRCLLKKSGVQLPHGNDLSVGEINRDHPFLQHPLLTIIGQVFISRGTQCRPENIVRGRFLHG